MKLEKLNLAERGCLVAAFLLLGSGCGKANSPQTSSSTHWQTELPSGGTQLASLSLNSPTQMVVDETGVIWLAACEGLFAVKRDEIQRYTWPGTLLPEGPLTLLADAQNRTWIFGGGELQVVEEGAFRSVSAGGIQQFSVGRDGSVWIAGAGPFDNFGGVWVRQILPTLGEEIDLPEQGLTGMAAGENGSLFIATSGRVYRWSGEAWAGPLASDVQALYYDPRRDVLSSDSERLRWSGTNLEREALLPASSAFYGQQIGFDADGRLVTVNDSAVSWIENGQVTESVALSGVDRAQVGAIGTGGAVVLASESGLFQVQGGAVTSLLDVKRFEPEVEFAWRAQSFGRTLAQPSVRMTREQLSNPSSDGVGVKVQVRGVAFGGFETAGVVVDGAVLRSTWAESANELAAFMFARGMSPFIEVPENLGRDSGTRIENEPPWDLYGYLETGSCFPQGTTRQFWMVEGYPADMPASERDGLAAALRAQYPEPAN